MGIFDTVAQVGGADYSNLNWLYNLSIPEEVGFTAHAVARNEYRSLFPLSSILSSYDEPFSHPEVVDAFTSYGRNIFLRPYFEAVANSVGPSDYLTSYSVSWAEQPFEGAHSDIGGGVRGGRNISALYWMWNMANSHGVPLKSLDSYKDFGRIKNINAPSDSRDYMGGLYRLSGDWADNARRIVYPHPRKTYLDNPLTW